MMKQLFSVLAVASAVTVSAQSSRLVKSAVAVPSDLDLTSNSITYKSNAASTVTLNPFTGTNVTVWSAGSDTATPGCSPNAGYIFGSNCYDDLEKAQYFAASSYSSVSQASVVAAQVWFFRSGTMGTGGTPTETVALKIYAGTSNTAAPGSLLGTAVSSLGAIMAAQTGTNILFPFTFTFTSAVPLTGGFYASITTPITAGDTVVVANQPSTPNNAWEKWDNNAWYAVSSSWGNSASANIGIFPILQGAGTVGLSKTALQGRISILPNPSNGIASVNVQLASPQNIQVSVNNALGQQIMSGSYSQIASDVINLDLTAQPNGVYFVTVSNGTEKTVQRLIISK